MNILVLPALFALIAKLVVIFVYRDSISSSTYFKLMIMLFASHNLCEVLVFWEYFRGINANYLLRTYYVISLAVLLSIIFAIADISNQKQRVNATPISFIFTIASLAILFSNKIVAGATELGYVLTAVRGAYYWVFQTVALVFLAQMIYLLVSGYRSKQSHESQIRCAYTALALVPQLLAVIAVITLMHFGFKVNGAVIFPVATTLFLFIMFASEDQHKITDIRRFIPFSEERRTSNQIMDIFSKYAQDKSSYRESISEIEKLLVEHKYEKHDRNATYTAESMGMPRSSLYSLFNRLGVKKD